MTALCRRVGGLGYAVPGSVIAIAIVYPFGAIDNSVDAPRAVVWHFHRLALKWYHWGGALCLCRAFSGGGHGVVRCWPGRIRIRVDGAARTLGARPSRVLFGVHMPMLKGAIFTSLLMVFVDVMKELPATMILRPLILIP